MAKRSPKLASDDPLPLSVDAPHDNLATEDADRPRSGWRLAVYRVIFESDTRAGRLFDIVLVVCIVASVAVVVLDSVPSLHARHDGAFDVLEWTFTALFTLEYAARLACTRRPLRYATSVFGVIDLLAVLPTYVGVFVPDASLLLDIRVLRLLRVFRIFRLAAYMHESSALGSALVASRRKIFVFLSFVVMVVLIMGTLMYVVEGPQNGFRSIPIAVYWAISTMTTVGFGDIVPKTDIGRAIASVMMLLGWGILAVPTGIVSAEFAAQRMPQRASRQCPVCLSDGHSVDARFCADCGAKLPARRHEVSA